MKVLSFFSVVILSWNITHAQPTSWKYDFGTEEKAAPTASSTSTTSSFSGKFLSPPPGDQAAKVRFGNNTYSSFELVTSGTTFGSGARLLLSASNGSNTNKFSLYNIVESTPVFSIGYKVKFNEGTAGIYTFAIGNGSQSTTVFQNGNVLASGASSLAETFVALTWTYTASGIGFEYRSGNSDIPYSGFTFERGKEYNIRIYCNNSAESSSYVKENNTISLPKRKFHIWVNNSQLMQSVGNPDFDASDLAEGSSLNAFMFNGYNNGAPSPGKIYLDDFVYANYLLDLQTLPVSLLSFNAFARKNKVLLKWSTASEINNSSFQIERSADGKVFYKIGDVSERGNTAAKTEYEYEDKDPLPGTVYYRLKQVDRNGDFHIYDPIAIDANVKAKSPDIGVTVGTTSIELSAYSSRDQLVNVNVYSLNGNIMFKDNDTLFRIGQGVYSFPVNLNTGAYLLTVQGDDFAARKKFIKN